MGKLIVFEGIDGSGKSTQSSLIKDRLKDEGIEFFPVTFPRYSQPSSALIKMYLGGEFGSDPESVNPYAASCFYAVDRYASFQMDWRQKYESGGLVIADRYTTSNAIHQGSKFPEDKRKDFFRWLYSFEFDLLKLPAPDAVFYMDTPLETALDRIRKRDTENGGGGDIHENDINYLEKCHLCGEQAAQEYGWIKISAVKDGVVRSRQEVHEEIYTKLKEILKNEQ